MSEDKKVDPIKEAQELIKKEEEKQTKMVADKIQAVLEESGYNMRILNSIELTPKK